MRALDPLFADLTLPKGTRLTPARREALALIGKALLEKNELTLYRSRVSSRALRYSVGCVRDSKVQHAILGMAKAGILTTAPASNGYSRYRLVVAEPFDTIAKRLAGAGVLRAERMMGRLAEPEHHNAETRQHAWDLGRKWSSALDDGLSTRDVLTLHAECMRAKQARDEAEQALAVAKAQAEREATPTTDEVMAWLVTRALQKPTT